ncbi:MAG: hypothetical protein IIC79_03515 [Chloroflexi bacterium]|nr:hypothetical protein [Chloroflexota bacterium]
MKTISHHNRSAWLAALALFMLLMGIYMLSFQGVPVTDDEQLFISAAQNLAIHGELSAAQMYGNTRLAGVYSGIGPLHPILAAPIYQLLQNTNLGTVQALYLLTPVYTALTAVVVFLLALHLGYRPRTGLAAGLLFGLSTIAWPYSQTFFREPLAALLLVSAWLCFEIATSAGGAARRKALTIALFAILYSAAVLTKVYIISALPAFLLLIWRRRMSFLPIMRTNKIRILIFLIGIVVILVAAYQPILSSLPPGINTRFSESFAVERVTHIIRRLELQDFAISMAGMLFSPSKGLLLYSPILMLAFFAIPKWGRARWEFLLVPFTALIGFLLAQYGAFLSAWWNITWSTRFLLPVIPLLVVAALPILDAMLNSGKREVRNTLWGLIAVSMLIQLSGVLIAAPTFLKDLYINQLIPDLGLTIWQLQHAPLIEHWRLLLTGTPPDLAFWRASPETLLLVVVSVSLNLILVGYALWLLSRFQLPKPPAISSRILQFALFMAAVSLTVSPTLMLNAYRAEPRYALNRNDLTDAALLLNQEPKPGDVISIDAYLSPAWYHFLNFGRPSVPWYSLPLQSQTSGRISTPTLFAILCQQFDRIWLLAETNPDSPDAVQSESILAEYGSMIDEWEWPSSSNRSTRLMLYQFAPACRNAN